MSTVHADPAKAFFVNMLTRDIELKDSLLDLLDNCVDGIQRTHVAAQGETSPYAGYSANVEFSEDRFCIRDNCGGIPKDIAEQYAFRMGRPANVPPEHIPTVGMYGIGMKRAIFKLGKKCRVTSQTNGVAYTVEISPEWLNDDDNWDLELREHAPTFGAPGTEIEITELHEEIRRRFRKAKESNFEDDFIKEIGFNYLVILKKGFRVSVNGHEAVPKELTLLADPRAFEHGGIAPYAYQTERDGVTVRLIAGFIEPPPSGDEDESEQPAQRRSAEDAGWTVICNDRVVLYKDKSRMTGWGEAGVPGYHNQFIAISGVVEFVSNSPKQLPWTTTKRGVNGNSELYLHVKNHMREALGLFTGHTNRWKGRRSEELRAFKAAEPLAWATVVEHVPQGSWRQPREEPQARVFVPDLPRPQDGIKRRCIRFFRPEEELQAVSKFLFDDPDQKASDVGDACFARALKEAQQ